MEMKLTDMSAIMDSVVRDSVWMCEEDYCPF